MVSRSRVREKLPILRTDKLPEPLSDQKIKNLKKWFNKNVPDKIRDVQNREIAVIDRDATFRHLISSTEEKGKEKQRKLNTEKAVRLNLIVPCLQKPVEVIKRGKEINYISPWKPQKGRRLVVICRRKDSSWCLATMFYMADGEIEKRRQNWENEYF